MRGVRRTHVFQSLGVGAGRFRSGLTVGETAGRLEDGIVGAADW
jgi:hypothetical protein